MFDTVGAHDNASGTAAFLSVAILEPKGDDCESRAVFNPGVIYSKGKFHMLYRAVGNETWIYLSRLGYASSRDG